MLLATLSDGVYVNEIKGKHNLEIAYALTNGIKILTSPYSNFECLRYNKKLIQEGAEIVLKSQDFAIQVL